MWLSGYMWLKVDKAKSGEKWWKVVKSGEKWWKVAKKGEKWWKLVKIGEKLRKAAKSGEKRRKAAKSGEKRRKAAKSGEKRRKAAKSGDFFFHKMAGGGHGRWWPFWMTENHFLAISYQYASSHFGSGFLPKSMGTYLYSRSVARSNMKLIGAFLMKLWSAQAVSSYFHKMAVGGHLGFPIFVKIDRVLPL